MKPHDTSISHKRLALCGTTLAFIIGAVAATAQSSQSGTRSGSSSGNTGSTYGQSSTGSTQSGSTTDSTRRNQPSGASTSGAYGSSSTRSGSTDSSYGSTTASGSMSSTSADKLSWGDKRFVTKAADHGQSEVALAKLASQQASNPEVRRYAQKLVNDHTKVNSELMNIASTKNVKLDKEDTQDRTYRRLSERSGSDFDQEFVEQMIDMHEADIKLFEKTAEDAKDQELRSFASRHVGHLREHLQQAQNLRQTIMPTGRDSDRNIDASTSTSLQGTATPSTDSTQSDRSSGSSSSNNTATGSSGEDNSRNNR